MANHWEIVNAGLMATNTPEELWARACKYFEWCDNSPLKARKTVMSGREAGKKVEMEYIRPYTIKGLCLHCNVEEEYLMDIRESKEQGSIWYNVISKILYIIYVQNFELACVGEFSPIFTAKALGSVQPSATRSKIRIEVVSGAPELSESENDILEKLELELSKNQNTDLENS